MIFLFLTYLFFLFLFVFPDKTRADAVICPRFVFSARTNVVIIYPSVHGVVFAENICFVENYLQLPFLHIINRHDFQQIRGISGVHVENYCVYR